MTTYSYQFRLTKKNIYDGSLETIIGSVNTSTLREVITVIKKVAIFTEILLLASIITKIEYKSSFDEEWFNIEVH